MRALIGGVPPGRTPMLGGAIVEADASSAMLILKDSGVDHGAAHQNLTTTFGADPGAGYPDRGEWDRG